MSYMVGLGRKCTSGFRHARGPRLSTYSQARAGPERPGWLSTSSGPETKQLCQQVSQARPIANTRRLGIDWQMPPRLYGQFNAGYASMTRKQGPWGGPARLAEKRHKSKRPLMTYQLCPKCAKPLTNEANLVTLRKKWIMWLGIGAGAGGVIGACVLPFLGFGAAGVTAGSFAASWQGPAVMAGSVFAIYQSLGATGLGILLFGAVGSVAGGVGALGLIYKNRELFDWCTCDKRKD